MSLGCFARNLWRKSLIKYGLWPEILRDLQNHGTMDLQQVKAGFQLVVACFVIRCGLVATLEIFEGNL